MARFYGADLLDFWRGALSARKLVAFLYGLPAESSYSQARVGGPQYTVTDLLLLQVDLANWRMWQAAGDSHLPKPTPMRRPGADRREQALSDEGERSRRETRERFRRQLEAGGDI